LSERVVSWASRSVAITTARGQQVAVVLWLGAPSTAETARASYNEDYDDKQNWSDVAAMGHDDLLLADDSNVID